MKLKMLLFAVYAGAVWQSNAAPIVSTLGASYVTSSSAQMNGSVNPNGATTSAYFQYGTTTSYGNSTSPATGITSTVNILSTWSGLSPNTTYHYRVVAYNSGGTSYGNDVSFTTSAAAPTATTLAASSISTTSATLNSSVNPNGASTTIYFQYGLTTSYGSTTTSGNIGTTSGNYGTSISGLSAGTTYHFRIVAYNSAGTSYGNDASFTTSATSPTVSTLPASYISTTSAQLNADVTPNGADTTAYFQYGLTTSYGSTTGSADCGSGPGYVQLISTPTGLTPGTTYHYRVVAYNSGGTSYGNDVSFTTSAAAPTATTLAASSISTTSATLNSSVNPNGASTTIYFQYGLTTSYGSTTTSGNIGTTFGDYGSSVSGLSPNTTYHFRIVAYNSAGTSYGNDASFTTSVATPTVSTLPASYISTTSAQMNGDITPNGADTTAYFQYGLTTSYGSTVGSSDVGSGTGIVLLLSTPTGLTPNTTYHYRVVAYNSGGTSYGNDTSFTTSAAAPTATTLAANSISTTSATLNSSVNPNNSTTTIYFQYGLTASYGSTTISGNIGTTSGDYGSSVSGLSPNTTYHFRIVAYNSAGTSYGNDASFTTSATSPTVQTLGASYISATSAQMNGDITPNGVDTTAYFQYGLTTSYGSTVGSSDVGSGMGIVLLLSTPTGLTPNTTYHYRVVAYNSGGTSYGNDVSFTTLTQQQSPTVQTLAASSVAATSATLNSSVNPNGASTTIYFQYGLTASYGSITISGNIGTTSGNYGTSISGLSAGVTYHFRIVANNTYGTSYGSDLTFTTTSTSSSVAGKVLSSSAQPIAGASVQIGSNVATSGNDGSYSITGLSAGNYPVTVSATGYITFSSTLTVPASAQLSQPFTLSPVGSSGSPPIVTSITTPYSPNGEALYFLDGVTFPVTFTATVNWGNHSAGTVQFLTPKSGTYPASANGGNTASQQIDVGSAFGPGGKLQVQAVSSDGSQSVSAVANFVVMSALPIQNFSAFSVMNEGGQFEYQSQTASSIQFLSDSLSGDDGLEIDQSIPMFGGNPIKLGFSPTLNATITGNHLDLLQVEVSNANANDNNDPGLDMAGLKFDMSNPKIDIFANYDATLQQWQWGGSLGINGDVGASATTYLPVPIPVPVFASVDFDLPFDATLALNNLEPVTWNGTINLDPTVTGTLGAGVDDVAALTGWIQGQVPLTFQYPQTPHLVSYEVQLSAGVTVYVNLWIINASASDQLFTWEWPKANPSPQILSPVLVNKPALMRPYPRNYLNKFSYAAFNGKSSTGFSPAIRPMGLPSGSPNPLLYALQTDIFPFSEPSISANGTNCYAVWLYDNPSRTANNQTMLVFSEFNGTSWSTFSPVADDGTADFHPQLRTFADGSAVVAWENGGTVLSTNAALTDIMTNLEIATAFYDPVAGAWQPMQQLTTNNYLDQSPRIAGPSESNLMLVWVANTKNDSEGSSANPNQLWFAIRNGSTWSTPQTFASVPYPLLKYDMTYDGTNAYVVMSLDADNTLTNVNAHELFEMAYQNGSWGGLTQLTTNQVPNDNPQLAIDPYGNIVLVWLQGNTLSSVVNFNFANQQIVGTNQYSSNLGNFKLANSSDGRLAIVWAVPSPQYPSDLYAMIYDPIFEVWGNPKQLTDDPETEMETAATFYGTNQLMALYDRVDIAIGDTNQIIQYGTVITNADLYVLQYQLTNNLVLVANSLTVSPANPAPGDTVTLSVMAENLGDSGVSNVLVAFYQGDPNNGGLEIGQTNLAVLLAPGATNVVSIPWTVPATTNPLPVYAVIDPYQQYPESDLQNEEVNNTFVEPELVVQSVTWGQIASNLLSITATVINEGTIASQPATVSFLVNSLTGTNLFSTNIVSLAPGQSIDVNFIWNVPSLGNGLSLFAVVNTGTNANFNPQNETLEMTIQPNITQVNVQLGPVLLLSGGTVQIGVTGLAGQTYPIQVSTNLVNWDFLTNTTLTNLSGQFIDSSAPNFSQRFYRSALSP